MAIEIISGNLNTFGNNGAFETDPSTWGFNGNSYGNSNISTRSSDFAKAGIYSNKVQCTVPFFGIFDFHTLAQARYTGVVGKKYLARVWVRTPTANPYATDDCEFSMETLLAPFLVAETKRTIVNAKDTWVQVEARWVHASGMGDIFLFVQKPDVGDELNTGVVYIDSFEIYEYIETSDTCTLLINVSGTVVTNETAPSANNGTITVATTAGTGPFEYSKDNGATWQGSNIFTGLAPGVYFVKVREIATPTCVSTQSFAVNSASATFSFTTAKTDETVLGAADGTIVVTPTGTVAPFTFSKDGGVTFQGSNLFTGLAPATYTIVVKDDNDVILSANVTIAAGVVIFEKVWFSKNFITKQVAASGGWNVITNYRLYDDVRVEDTADSGTFNSKLTVAHFPDSDGSVLFQVRQAFRNIMEPVAPEYNTEGITRLTDRIKYFKHYTGEMDGTDELPASLTASLPNLVLWGGLDKFNAPTLDFFGTYSTHKKFMSWAPLVKQVDPLQEDYLTFWLWKSGVSVIYVKCKAYFDDDTNQTATVATMAAPGYARLYQIAAGPLNSGVKDIDPEKNLVKYDLWLQDSSLAISETRTYVLDEFSYPDVKHFMFLNSLGSFEVMRFYGSSMVSNSFTREVIKKYLAPGYAASDGEKAVNNALRTSKENYSSGYFTGSYAEEWQQYMNDFMLTKKLYDVTDGTRRQVVITEGSLETDTKDYKRFFRFSCEDAYDNSEYTP